MQAVLLKPAGMVTMPSGTYLPIVPASAGKDTYKCTRSWIHLQEHCWWIKIRQWSWVKLHLVGNKISQETEASGRVGGAGMIGSSAITGAAAGTAIMPGFRKYSYWS
jgi:hypothetical protein